MLRKDLGDFIKSKRTEALISQEDLALKAGITVRTIWGLEAGGTEPHFKTLRKIATALEIDPKDFLAEREIPA
jgi:transcriptional regulator with XRE-family HTH domain